MHFYLLIYSFQAVQHPSAYKSDGCGRRFGPLTVCLDIWPPTCTLAIQVMRVAGNIAEAAHGLIEDATSELEFVETVNA